MVPTQSPVVEKNPTEVGTERTVISLLSTPATVAFNRIFPDPAVAHGITNVIELDVTLTKPTGCPFAVSDVDPSVVGRGWPEVETGLTANPDPRTTTSVPGAKGYGWALALAACIGPLGSRDTLWPGPA